MVPCVPHGTCGTRARSVPRALQLRCMLSVGLARQSAGPGRDGSTGVPSPRRCPRSLGTEIPATAWRMDVHALRPARRPAGPPSLLRGSSLSMEAAHRAPPMLIVVIFLHMNLAFIPPHHICMRSSSSSPWPEQSAI
eukprot:138626-Chlamydomonas_euryale.AAC.3